MNSASFFALGRPPGATLLRGLVVLAVMIFAPSSVHAKRGHSKDVEAKEALPAQARRACLSGDYEKGVAILTDLFMRTKQPDWVYNQGRCLEQNARYEDAILRFEEYLRLTKGSGAGDRASAEEHIAECRSKIPKPEPIVTPPPRPEAFTPGPVLAQETSASQEVQTPRPPQKRTGLRVAGIILEVLGAGALTTAALLNLNANNMANDLNKPAGYDQDKAARRDTQELLGWIGYGVGAACLTGGAVLLYLGYRSADSSHVAVTPSVASGQAGLSVQGVF